MLYTVRAPQTTVRGFQRDRAPHMGYNPASIFLPSRVATVYE